VSGKADTHPLGAGKASTSWGGGDTVAGGGSLNKKSRFLNSKYDQNFFSQEQRQLEKTKSFNPFDELSVEDLAEYEEYLAELDGDIREQCPPPQQPLGLVDPDDDIPY